MLVSWSLRGPLMRGRQDIDNRCHVRRHLGLLRYGHIRPVQPQGQLQAAKRAVEGCDGGVVVGRAPRTARGRLRVRALVQQQAQVRQHSQQAPEAPCARQRGRGGVEAARRQRAARKQRRGPGAGAPQQRQAAAAQGNLCRINRLSAVFQTGEEDQAS